MPARKVGQLALAVGRDTIDDSPREDRAMQTPLHASSTDRSPRPPRPGSPTRTTACQGLLAGLLVVAAAAPAAEPPLPPGAIVRLGETRFRHGNAVHCLAFSPDGKVLACGGGGLTLWGVATGKPLHPSGDKRLAWAASLAFSPDGKHIVTAASRGVHLWDTSTGKLVRDLKGHTNGVEAVAWSDDGRWIASGSRDGTVRVWDAKAGKVAHVFPIGKGWAEQLVFAPASRLLAASCRDGTLRVWEPAAGKERHWFKDQQMAAAAFSPDGSVLVWSSGGGGELRVWAPEGKSPPRVLRKG
jgi:WD40 repeat protein